MQTILAEIITIGDELLIGQVVDTNATWMAESLNAVGIKVYQMVSVSDNSEHITSAIKDASNRVDIVLLTGGLGPTKDDLTKQCLVDYFGSSLVIHQASLDFITKRFAQRGWPLSEINRQQAAVPNNCEVIENTCGTAPGMWFQTGKTVLVSMPGVPREMKRMMADVIPKLVQYFDCPAIHHRTLMTYGLPESSLSDLIEDWELSLASHLKLAYLPELSSGVKLRLSGYGASQSLLKHEIDTAFQQLQTILGKLIYGEFPETLAGAVGQLLIQNKANVAVAESCTGGLIAHRFTSVPGSSLYFKGGVVAYSNEIKSKVLGVDPKQLEIHGAVSEIVATQMAEGVRELMQTDYGIATTGVAGPDGGTPDKPVGLCWIAVASKHKTLTLQLNSIHDRQGNIETAASQAINLLRLAL